MSHPPLLLRPHYVVKPWGGRRLETELGRDDLPLGPVGESWEAIDTPELCSVVDGGPHDGVPLRDVLGEPFPLLLKVLDAQRDLSVQVHPDGAGGGPAKEEAWVALASGGAVATGEVTGDLPQEGAWLDRLERHALAGPTADAPPALVHVPPRTVHSILAGSLLFEVQNPVDVTWRLDDFGRPGTDGRPRALHLAEARNVLRQGAEAAAATTSEGRRLDGTRFWIELLPPGHTDGAAARAAFFFAAGVVDVDGARFDVPAGRTVVLPSAPVSLEASGWIVATGT